jgi:hypothetical protein
MKVLICRFFLGYPFPPGGYRKTVVFVIFVI